MALTDKQLQKFNELIGSGRLSGREIVNMMRQHNITIDQLPALNSPGLADKLDMVRAAFGGAAAAQPASGAAVNPAAASARPAAGAVPPSSGAHVPPAAPGHAAAGTPAAAADEPPIAMPDTDLSPEQLKAINNQIGSMSGPQIVKIMSAHNLSVEHLPALSRKENAEKCRFVENILLSQREQQDWSKVQAVGDSPAAMPVMLEYVNRWRGKALAAAHVAELEPRIQALRTAQLEKYRIQEEQEWTRVLMAPTISALATHVRKWEQQGVDIHKIDADAKAWELVQASPNSIAASKEYLNMFGDTALHAPEVRAADSSVLEWEKWKASGDIFTINQYLKGNLNPLVAGEARMMLQSLKCEEVARMTKEQDMYPGDRLISFVESGIFTEQELITAGVATENSLNILNNLIKIKDTLPVLVDVQAECQLTCAPNRTDVYLFGTPATGKTCVLMGILGSDFVYYNSVAAAGEYAMALRRYLDVGFTPGQTETEFVATVQAKIVIRDGIEHHINLVELAGEEFALNVAKAKNGVISFAEMGPGVTELLANNNRKVFFVIIDPTSEILSITKTVPLLDANGQVMFDQFGQPRATTRKYLINQADSLKRMIDMLGMPENAPVLDRVDAIHVIVTKGDKLGDAKTRAAAAQQLLKRSYPSFIGQLVQLCKMHNINYHPNPERNGVPRLFTFSLGHFFPGGLYEYDPTDANRLVTTIANYTPV